jgi:hypothetical protein
MITRSLGGIVGAEIDIEIVQRPRHTFAIK